MNTTFRIVPWPNSSILRLNAERDTIKIDPEYQRRGEIWTLQKRQLLIDSIINGYDIPKLYFHTIPYHSVKGKKPKYEFAIIDGRQRVETIWSFMSGQLKLADDFVYLKNANLKVAGLTYPQIAKQFPRITVDFDSTILSIICIETEDPDVIDDMFLRLNEAVPLNAAEKRNAIGGPMATTINNVANHSFFAKKVRFRNSRYQHREVAARLLFLQHSLAYSKSKKIVDTKKEYLDQFVRDYKGTPPSHALRIKKDVDIVLNAMTPLFKGKDELLRAQSIIHIYYLVFRAALQADKLKSITRSRLERFRLDVERNRSKAETDISNADYELLEFDLLSRQGTNDAGSIKERARILGAKLGIEVVVP